MWIFVDVQAMGAYMRSNKSLQELMTFSELLIVAWKKVTSDMDYFCLTFLKNHIKGE